jgi:tetratricopeptide (TPR) repeat protein
MADVSVQLQQAQALINDGQYEQAKSLYQKILAENPNSDAALEAQKQIVIIHIATNNQAEADAAFEQLSEKYSKHKGFSDAVCVIGDNYLRRSIHEKARDMYKIAVVGATAPDSFWPKMGLAITSVDLADFETGDSLTKQIFSEFADDDRISMASRKIGDAYRHIDHHEQAIELYQYVLDNHADSEHAMWSQMGIATANNYLGNYDAAEAATEKLCKNYAEHPSIYKAIQAIADHYRWRNVQYKRARELYAVASEGMSGPDSIWPKRGFVDLSIRLSDFETANLITDQILNDFEDNEDLPQVACLIAEAYHHAGQYDAASALNQYLLDNFPGHKQLLQVKALMVKIDIAQGNDTSIEKSIDNLYVEFKDHPELAEVIFNIG